MKRASKVFSKDDRDLLHGILKGTAEGTAGVPLRGYLAKIQASMAVRDQQVTTLLISQRLYWKTNDQLLWQTVFELVEEERPGLFAKLSERMALGIVTS